MRPGTAGWGATLGLCTPPQEPFLCELLRRDCPQASSSGTWHCQRTGSSGSSWMLTYMAQDLRDCCWMTHSRLTRGRICQLPPPGHGPRGGLCCLLRVDMVGFSIWGNTVSVFIPPSAGERALGSVLRCLSCVAGKGHLDGRNIVC